LEAADRDRRLREGRLAFDPQARPADPRPAVRRRGRGILDRVDVGNARVATSGTPLMESPAERSRSLIPVPADSSRAT